MNRFLGLLLAVFAFLALGIANAPVEAKNIGADPPLRCNACGCRNAASGGPSGNCSSSVRGSSGTSFSLTEGTDPETYPVVAVKSSTDAQLDLSLSYSSYNADISRARFDTVLGIGWTHSYNLFLYSVRGNMFRVDADGRVTKYQLVGGGSYTAAAGYFETIVNNLDGSFTITDKYQTKTRYVQLPPPGTPFMKGTPVWRLHSITDRNNNVTQLTYDSGGNLTTVTDTYGRSLTFAYNAQNAIALVTDPLGRTTTFDYDATATELVRITDPAGRSMQYTYNTLAQITSKIDKDGRLFTYAYSNAEPTGFSDATGAPYFSLSNPNNWATDATQLALNFVRQYVPSTTSKTDGRGNVWKYSYDLHGYVTSMSAPDGATWTYTYDAATLMPASQTDANGNTTTYQYDSKGNLIKRTDALGHVTTYTYEPVFNMMTSMTDPNGRTTSWSYDARGNRIQETDPLGGVRTWTYDGHGNVLTDTDKNGNTTTYTYDAFGNRIQATDPLGNMTQMTYNGVGNLISTTDANNHTTTNSYDSLDRIIKVTDALGHITTTTYDGQGNRISVTDRDGNTTSYQYDARSRLIKVIDALGQTMTTTYDGNNNRLSLTDKNGQTTAFAYDVQNRLNKTVDALGDTGTMAYDAVGNKVNDTDANGHVTTYTYDPLNRMISKIDAVGSVTVLAYDSTGPCAGCTGPTEGSSLVSKQTDGDGKVIYFKYDGLDRLIREVRKQGGTADTETPSDAVTVYTYDPNGNRLTMTEPDGNTTMYTFDADNRLVKTVNAAGDTTLTAYDGVSNIISVTAPTTNVTTTTYDALNRITLVQDGGGTVASYTYDAEGNQLTLTDGNGDTTSITYDAIYRVVQTTDPLGKKTIYVYDPVGNLLSTTDRNGFVTSNAYDAINRRISVTDALGNTTQYQYDPVGNLIKLTDANAHVTLYVYDAVNRRITETYADGFSKSYSYDFVGNLTSRTDQNGVTTSYTYSDLYFLLTRAYPSSTDVMTYDLSGRMLSAERGGWLVTFSYDGANRVVQTVQNTKILSYSYNIPARIRTLTYPGGRTITESMDLRSRLSQIDDASSPPPIVSYSYDPGNRVLRRDYRKGTTAAYSYTDCNLAVTPIQCQDWITNLQHNLGATSIAGFNYAYDNEGNKHFEQKQPDSADSQHKSECYGYDPIYRLIDYKVGNLVGSCVPLPSTQTQYSLDPVGNWNIKTKDAIPEVRSHNAVNEITTTRVDSGPLCALSYDNNGNLTKDCVYSYTYDEENRLFLVMRNSDHAMVGRYAYDALSRRVVKRATPAGVQTITGYFYDDARIVEEQDGTGVTQATYVYGNYIDEILTMDRGGQPYYYHQNALWSVEAITDRLANVAERYSYDAYGLPIITDGAGNPIPLNAWGTPHSTIGNPWMFTGRQFDEEAGLYFYRARYYDPMKGRFLQRDPLEYVNGMNLYEFVMSNPVNLLDPDGLTTGDFFNCCICCLCGFERSDFDKLLRTLRTASTGAKIALTGEVPLCGIKIPSQVIQELSQKLGKKIGEQATKKICATATGIGAVIWAYDIGKCAINCEGELRRDNLGPLKPPAPSNPAVPRPENPTPPSPDKPAIPHSASSAIPKR